MPIFSYRCGKGHQFDELFFQREEVPQSMKCHCGDLALKRHDYRFRVVGPVFEHLEAYEKALLLPRERAAGARIRDAKDLARVEKEQGIHREDATFYRVAREEMRHEAWQIETVKESGGVGAALDFVDDINIKEATGWNQQELNTWKERTDEAEKSGINADAGNV